jgi:uncharacterized repeat protein (TIGR03803 family)
MRTAIFTLMLAICLCGLAFSQSTETVLYSFGAYPTDAAFPQGGLLFDAAGNIYGTTNGGGQYCQSDGGCGTVYELSPAVGGGWTETILYNFCSVGITCLDGSAPYAGLIMDGDGNLYGTTSYGGTESFSGTVFRLSPPTSGTGSWTETVLWNFAKATDNGDGPGFGKLNMDAAGNIYGTAAGGGAKNLGVVFELSPQGDGTFSFSILHSFSGADGYGPQYGVSFDSAGNLYGTTEHGGLGAPNCIEGCGVVYQLSPVNGIWQETVLYKFNGVVGQYPVSPISIDQSGSLYGTFLEGGVGGCFFGTCGGVFKLAPQAGGSSKKYAFYFNGGSAGGEPWSGVVLGGSDTVYGSVGTIGLGNVYMLQGAHETILYSFCPLPNCADGQSPSYGNLVRRGGALYGSTYLGGQYGVGVVYSLTK